MRIVTDAAKIKNKIEERKNKKKKIIFVSRTNTQKKQKQN
jgi:hypothetical protein